MARIRANDFDVHVQSRCAQIPHHRQALTDSHLLGLRGWKGQLEALRLRTGEERGTPFPTRIGVFDPGF